MRRVTRKGQRGAAESSDARGALGFHVGDRVDRTAVEPDFEMAMRAGGAAARTDLDDSMAGMDARADVGDVARVVRVAGHVAVAVVDLDHIAVTAALAGPGHHAIGYRVDVRAEW